MILGGLFYYGDVTGNQLFYFVLYDNYFCQNNVVYTQLFLCLAMVLMCVTLNQNFSALNFHFSHSLPISALDSCNGFSCNVRVICNGSG